MNQKPNLIFFSRSVYTQLFPKLTSNFYDSYHCTLNIKEKAEVEALGGTVVGCFEEEFDQLEIAPIPPHFLQSSFQPDRFMGWLTLKERQEILGKAISFWQRILNERQYEAGIHETIAIEQEEIFSLMLRKHNIQDFNFLVSAVPEHFIWKPDPYHSSFPAQILDNTPISDSNLNFAKKIIQNTKQKGHKPSFLIQKNRLQKSKLWHFTSKVKNQFKETLGLNDSYSREEKKRDSIFYYNQLGTHFNYDIYIKETYPPSKPYDNLSDYKHHKKIFFPFHLEPEATLLYFNPKVAEQLNVILQIIKQLPLDYVLLVKEHPNQPGYLLRKEYQQLKKQNSNIAFIAAEVDSHKILKEIDAVITICGSVGWEALINNIPVLVLGNVFYDKHPDVHNITNFTEIRKLLEGDKTSLNIPNDKNTLHYLAKFIAHNHEGNPTDIKLYKDSKNIKDITKSLAQKLHQSYPWQSSK